MIRDERAARLLGPYGTHQEALDNVDNVDRGHGLAVGVFGR
jgi:hypothetical protein